MGMSMAQQIERERISGMSIEEYRAWMKDTCEGMAIRNDIPSADNMSLDDIINSMRDANTDLHLIPSSTYSVTPHTYGCIN